MADLVEQMTQSGLLHDDVIAEAFRCVDRALFLPEALWSQAYDDRPLRHAEFHQSAPHIYASVLQTLQVNPGSSFLNIGSGTGFLSTVVGVLLGPSGVNHGVELMPALNKFAIAAVGEFLDQCIPPFAVPTFVQGHVLDIDVANNRKYSHIYCGFSISADVLELLLPLLANGGVMLAPVEDEFLKCTRSLNGDVTREVVSNVMFMRMAAKTGLPAPFTIGTAGPEKLTVLCRAKLRQLLGDRACFKIHALEIPDHLKMFLNYEYTYDFPEDSAPEDPTSIEQSPQAYAKAIDFLRKLGNEYFLSHRHHRALRKYTKALAYVECARLIVHDHHDATANLHALNDASISLLLNRAACMLKMHPLDADLIVSDCSAALNSPQIDPSRKAKAYYRRAKARARLNALAARSDLHAALECAPGDAKMMEALRQLDFDEDEGEDARRFRMLLGRFL